MPSAPLSSEQLQAIREQESREFLQRCEDDKDRKAQTMTARKLCDVASRSGKWIYEPTNKEWFTPDEYLEKYGKYYGDHPIIMGSVLKNPEEGVDAGLTRITELLNKILLLTERIIVNIKDRHGSDI